MFNLETLFKASVTHDTTFLHKAFFPKKNMPYSPPNGRTVAFFLSFVKKGNSKIKYFTCCSDTSVSKLNYEHT